MLETPWFDYLSIRSYTIRIIEMAILLCGLVT
jgi:hypothetical protein